MVSRTNNSLLLLVLIFGVGSVEAQDKRAKAMEKLIAGNEPIVVDGERIFRSKEVSQAPVIVSKPEPPFGEKARSHGAHGTVLMRAILKSTGEVQVLYVLKALRYGLTENALDAAAKIQFRPAQLDGKSVSQIILLQYNFN